MNTTVQWGSKKFDVKCDPSKPVSAFMEILQNLTGVPVDRQKLCMRRKQLKKEDNFAAGEVKEGAKFMLIGTAEMAPIWTEVPEEPQEEIKEDEEVIPEDALVGFKNYGNTCYLNSCLQVLRSIPELKAAINEYVTSNPSPHPFIQAVNVLFNKPPTNLPVVIHQLRQLDPQFAEIDEQTKNYRQQDASECMGKILDCFRREIGGKVIDLFNIGLVRTLKDLQEKHKDEIIEDDDDRLRCSIDSETRQIEQGILNPTEVEKRVEGEKEDTIWMQTTKITHLPKYLMVQMLRFTYRKDEATTAKIVRRVQHPYKLDVLSWLTGEQRQKCVEAREAGKETNAGYYKLKAVLTHQGRSADSGHYISHVLVKNQWIRYDDEKVKEIEEEDVDNLAGSADWHCSFVLLYEAI